MFDASMFSVLRLDIYTGISIMLTGHPILPGLPQPTAAVRCRVSLLPLREFTDQWTTLDGKSQNSPPRHNHSLLYKGEEQRRERMYFFIGCNFNAGHNIKCEQ